MCSFWWDWYWIGRSQRFCFPSCPHVCSWPISWVDSCKVQRALTAPQIWGRYSVIQKHLQIKFPPLYGFAIIQPWLLNSSCRINWPPCEKKKKKTTLYFFVVSSKEGRWFSSFLLISSGQTEGNKKHFTLGMQWYLSKANQKNRFKALEGTAELILRFCPC